MFKERESSRQRFLQTCNFHKSMTVTAFFLKHFSIQLRYLYNNFQLSLTIIVLYFFTIFYLSSCHPITCYWLCICTVQGIACPLSSAILLCSIVVLHSYINSGKSSRVYKPSFHDTHIHYLMILSLPIFLLLWVGDWWHWSQGWGRVGWGTQDRMDTNNTVRLDQNLNSKVLLKKEFRLNQNFHLQGLQFMDTAQPQK